jgi:excisionase family DNA binding protein
MERPMDERAHDRTQAATSRLLTIRDVADLAGVSIMTVRRWIEQNGLQIHRLGRLVRISQGDLDAFFSTRRQRNDFR